MQTKLRIRWWQWPNVLALDASLVGVGWLLLVANALGLSSVVAPAASWVLGLSVWLVYTTDRWLDVRELPIESIPTVRHAFMKRWGKGMLVLWGMVFLLDVGLAFWGLSFAEIADGFALLGLAVLHTWLTRKRYFRMPLKEVVIGLAFASSIPVFLWGMVPSQPSSALLVPSFERTIILFAAWLFGLLCFANCALIAERERDIDRALGRSSVAQKFPEKRLIWAGLSVVVGLIACRVFPFALFAYYGESTSIGVLHGLTAALATSGALLGLLGVLMPKLPPEVFRVLADTSMLTPWVVLGWHIVY